MYVQMYASRRVASHATSNFCPIAQIAQMHLHGRSRRVAPSHATSHVCAIALRAPNLLHGRSRRVGAIARKEQRLATPRSLHGRSHARPLRTQLRVASPPAATSEFQSAVPSVSPLQADRCNNACHEPCSPCGTTHSTPVQRLAAT